VHGFRSATIFPGTRSRQEFASILSRERDRADRTGVGFSLAAFHLGSGGESSACARRLARILTTRIRSTDEIGWLEDGRLGVVLPHTAPDNAWKFIGNVRRALDGDSVSVDCNVYAYPSPVRTQGEETPPQDPRLRRREDSRDEPGESGMQFTDPAANRQSSAVMRLAGVFLAILTLGRFGR
jgi:hypothetical protein